MFKFNANMTNEELDAEYARVIAKYKEGSKKVPNEAAMKAIKEFIEKTKKERKEQEKQREIDLLMRAD